jgi:uncharacterized membrane protein YgaE (UPF0421/DUF939 family)
MFGIDPFYTCIAAVSTTQSSIQSSFIVGRDRMIGSTIGAIYGVIFSCFGNYNALLTSLALLSVIYTVNFIKSKGAVYCVFVVISIMVDHTVPTIENGLSRLFKPY